MTPSQRDFLADVLHDCLSSFQGLDHSEGVCCFDRERAVEYLLSPSSGLMISLSDDVPTDDDDFEPDDASSEPRTLAQDTHHHDRDTP